MDISQRAMSEIVGNETLKIRLCQDIVSNSLNHAYIIEGPTGSGRHTVALMAAAALACENKNDISKPIPCLDCPTCKKIIQGKSPDVIFKGTEGKTTIGVDIARFLREDVHFIPNDIDHKIYIIEDADKMTPQAQNAILLTLEEPPSFVHFFLLCNNAASLLETIRSRAPILRTEALTDGQIDEYICKHDRRAAQMKLSDENEYAELLKVSAGGIGRALELLEPKSWKPIREQRKAIDTYVSCAVNRASNSEMLPLLYTFSKKRDILADQLLLLSSAVRDLILIKKSDTAYLTFYCDVDRAIELSDKVSLSFLYNLQIAITNAIEENKRNANVRLLITKMLLCADLI